MGYTHHWRRARTFGRTEFESVRTDFEQILPALVRLGVPLAGPCGDGEPVITAEEIAFNGVRMCAHKQRDLGITWPAPGASGVHLPDEGGSERDGTWFGGRLLPSRTCDGDCSYESFDLPREVKPSDWQKPDEHGRFFAFCKTAYRPYDLAVQVCLVIAAHHLGPDIAVSSDGSMDELQDAIALCDAVLGYGSEFQLN